MKKEPLFELIDAHNAAKPFGLPSVCSAHPLVIEAALRQCLAQGGAVLLEATCNQVNQDGGYTGMSPAEFRHNVYSMAEKAGVRREQLILGGDHLGPNPWKHLPADEAMKKATAMVFAYAEAGFNKIHLDASMACADDPKAVAKETIAERAAKLAAAAEEGVKQGGHSQPAYIVGTEVPVPGGAAEVLDSLTATDPEDAAETLQMHKEAFSKLNLGFAYERIVGLVVQPGVEFGHENIIYYDPPKAASLTAWRKKAGSIVFEAHSTDYQPEAQLSALVRDGFGILKVGPGLTFALREALYALDHIATELVPDYPNNNLQKSMEAVMRANPKNWAAYYTGRELEQYLLRHYSYSDRIRYYWTDSAAQAAVERLLSALADTSINETLISQHLPSLYPEVVAGNIAAKPHELLIEAIRKPLQAYSTACALHE